MQNCLAKLHSVCSYEHANLKQRMYSDRKNLKCCSVIVSEHRMAASHFSARHGSFNDKNIFRIIKRGQFPKCAFRFTISIKDKQTMALSALNRLSALKISRRCELSC